MIKQTEKNARSLSGATSLWGALSCALVCGTLAYIAYLVLAVQPDRTRRLWIPVVVDSNGNQTILGETRQLEFWTPSVKTKDYLSKDAGQISDKEKWQAIDSDDAVLRFGEFGRDSVALRLGDRRRQAGREQRHRAESRQNASADHDRSSPRRALIEIDQRFRVVR